MGLSATPTGPACPSRASGWRVRRHRRGFPCCAPFPLPCVPPPLPRRNPTVLASLASRPAPAFPDLQAGRLPHHKFRGLLSVHYTLRPAWLLSLPRRPVTSECFKRCRYLHHPPRLLPAGATVAGRDSHPLGKDALARRTVRVAPGDYSPEALTRTGQGDFHHPAPPLMCLVAILPISALQLVDGEAGSVSAID